MKKMIMAIAATLALATTAFASDLPSRRAAPAPVATEISYPTGWYVGVNGGATAGNKDDWGFQNSTGLVGAVVGYEINPFVRVEGNFTHRFKGNSYDTGQMATVNVIGQYTIPGTRLTPYVLGGVGYGWNYYGDLAGKGATLWNLGGGMRIALDRRWELDARYRYIQQFESYVLSTKANENQLTLGVNYKF